jgi:hypothetical protein
MHRPVSAEDCVRTGEVPIAETACGLFYFLHIPKAGGTSAGRFFKHNCASDNCVLHPWDRSGMKMSKWDKVMENVVDQPYPPHVFLHHHGYPAMVDLVDKISRIRDELHQQGCSLFLATIAREPVDRTLSLIRYNKVDQNGNVTDYIINHSAGQVKTLLFSSPHIRTAGGYEITNQDVDTAIDVLKHFDFVALTEKHSTFEEVVSMFMGFPSTDSKYDVNKTPKERFSYEMMSPLQQELIIEGHAKEGRWYSWASERHAIQWEQMCMNN